MELSSKALGAAMFMATVCLYMGIEIIKAKTSDADITCYIPFAFLLHGIVFALMTSGAWVLCFGLIKTKNYIITALLTLIILLIITGVSIVLPVINTKAGYLIWIISCFASSFLFITGVTALYIKLEIKTGIRSVLLWELK